MNQDNNHQHHSFRPNSQNNPRGGNNSEKQIEPNPYDGYYCRGNLGLLFTRRYYSGITKEVLNQKKITIARQTSKGDKPEKTDHQTLYYDSRNSNIINQARSFKAPDLLEFPDIYGFSLTTIYPGLLIGSGILHSTGHKGEAKLGLLFDHTTGLPYIPGSSLKGLLRSLFPLRDVATANKLKKKGQFKKAEAILKQADQKREFIAELLGDGFSKDMIDDIEKSIFDGIEYDEKGKIVYKSRRDIFFDAFPSKAGNAGLIDLDYITPHKSEFTDPNPIQFMRVSPGVSFKFQFQLFPSEKCGEAICSAPQKKALFEKILTTVGIGAKTNVGYGQLK